MNNEVTKATEESKLVQINKAISNIIQTRTKLQNLVSDIIDGENTVSGSTPPDVNPNFTSIGMTVGQISTTIHDEVSLMEDCMGRIRQSLLC